MIHLGSWSLIFRKTFISVTSRVAGPHSGENTGPVRSSALALGPSLAQSGLSFSMCVAVPIYVAAEAEQQYLVPDDLIQCYRAEH
jgi:hypothetical protein